MVHLELSEQGDGAAIRQIQTHEHRAVGTDRLIQNRTPTKAEDSGNLLLAVVSTRNFQTFTNTGQVIIGLLEVHVAVSNVDRFTRINGLADLAVTGIRPKIVC